MTGGALPSSRDLRSSPSSTRRAGSLRSRALQLPPHNRQRRRAGISWSRCASPARGAKARAQEQRSHGGQPQQAHQPDRSAIGTATSHSCFSSVGNIRRIQIAGKSNTVLHINPGLVSPVLKRDGERWSVKVRTPRKCGCSPYFREVPENEPARAGGHCGWGGAMAWGR